MFSGQAKPSLRVCKFHCIWHAYMGLTVWEMRRWKAVDFTVTHTHRHDVTVGCIDLHILPALVLFSLSSCTSPSHDGATATWPWDWAVREEGAISPRNFRNFSGDWASERGYIVAWTCCSRHNGSIQRDWVFVGCYRIDCTARSCRQSDARWPRK